ncbi:hypothetical protein GGS24DRAFT_457496 [Hypoxylon argillaceum]|nr:hypothetical protein GGS24DRAFT_457496 [Hypoxylon argillaceum]KAI1146393.1 hypothetical protein F4825DRAFT_440899 [Nemania diffusa]
MNIPAAINALLALSRRLGSRRLQPIHSSRSIATTTFGVETPQPPKPPASPPTESWTRSHQGLRVRRRKRLFPRLRPVNSYKVTPYKLVKIYTNKLKNGHPLLIANLPGFLDSQSWFDLTGDQEVSFKTPRKHAEGISKPGFDLLRTILESAATGRNQRNLTPSPEAADMRSVFDDLEAECKIERASFEGDYPPLLSLRDWISQSSFKDYPFEKTIIELQETFQANPQVWIPFRAPLSFIRAVHQYNQSQNLAMNPVLPFQGPPEDTQHHPACITRITSLVVLQKELTEEFPFPRILRSIGLSHYHAKSCSIRAGVRPLRSDMRRYKKSTVVVGQLAGYSIVTLIPPRLKLLDGKPLDFHPRLPKHSGERITQRFPFGATKLALPGKTWTREFEDELAESGDILIAELIPGHGLLIPEGWFYGVRSINNGLELHGTVTWFLGRGELDVGDQEEFNPGAYRRTSPMWVSI